MNAQKPLELILARNLLASISTPAFLVGEEGRLLFYNDAAAALLGRRFEETGTMTAQEWTTEFCPFDENDRPIPYNEISLVMAVREGRPAHGTFRIAAADHTREIAASAIPIVGPKAATGAIVIFWPTTEKPQTLDAIKTSPQQHRDEMNVKIWGARGSVPAPGPETMRYGGNTSCVEVTLSDGSTLILDAGTGIRNLGLALRPSERPINVLLTHLHLDHIQGLMFFAPLFRPQCEIVVWGPASPESPLRDRIGRYISAPLAPVEIRELPALVSFRETDPVEWRLGAARVRAQAVNHRGPTLGYRIEDGDEVLSYIPDHEPGLGTPLAECDDEWISGFELARDASLLIHDCQYTDNEYPEHLGWGHSPLADALSFGRRVAAERLLLFHHDPLHSDDFLDSFCGEVVGRWQDLGGDHARVELATERRELTIAARRPAVSAAG